MTGWGWAEVLAVLSAVGFGVVSALVPVVNAEVYVVASQVSAVAGLVPTALGLALGQTVGKVILFLGVRGGRQVARAHRPPRRVRDAARPPGPFRRRLRHVTASLLQLVGQKRWGLPITLLAAVVGLPPLYAVALLAGATRMRVGWFALAVLVGRILRFLLLALGAHQLVVG